VVIDIYYMKPRSPWIIPTKEIVEKSWHELAQT